MCGRVFVRTSIEGIIQAFSFARKGEAEQMGNEFPRWNGAPRQDYPIIIWEPDVEGPVFMRATWGLIPRWMKDPRKGAPPPINARAETIATNGMFKHAYQSRRALMPIDGYFEWQDIFGTGKNKQPYGIAMKSGKPFALAAIWEEWRNPETGENIRTFAVVTCEANEMMSKIHDRMPVIIDEKDYREWLLSEEPPSHLLKPYPSDLMEMWPVSRDVGSPRNDRPDLVDPIELEKSTDPAGPERLL